MNGDNAARIVFLVAALILPLSALIARRMPVGKSLRLALIWVAIIVAVAILIGATLNSSAAVRFT